MLGEKDLDLLLDLVNRHRKESSRLNVGARPHPYIQEADGIITELVAMRDSYRRSVAALRLAHTGKGGR